MANPEHLEILRQGEKAWNLWISLNPNIRPDLSYAVLEGEDMRGRFMSANLFCINLRGANLTNAHFKDVDMRGADLSNANLRNANFTNARLSDAVFSGASFTDAILAHSDLQKARLYASDLSSTRIFESNLRNTILIEARLVNSKLNRVNLNQTDLRGAIFRNAELFEVDFSGADLRRVEFTTASMGSVTFGNCNLSQVKGLETVGHFASSTIGIDTIYRSNGEIPDSFLRGVGLPDDFITYVSSLVGRAIEFYSCFISYSSKDHPLAERLYADLQSRAVRCWFAPEDLKIGDKLRPRIDETIRIHDKLLLILSKNSISSQWVEQEVETALSKEREQGRTVLFPIRLDNTVLEITTGWPSLIKNTRHIGDFTRWSDYIEYQKAFSRLLRDLKTEKS